MNDLQATAATSNARESPQPPWPSPGKAWYGVGFFALTLLVLFANGGITNLLIQSIKTDLHLTDTQVSLIIGFAAAALNACFSLPVSRLVDIVSRRLIIGVGLLTASVTSALSGIAHGFGQLFIVRMLAGLGGSGNATATYSMLADFFPPAKLPKALSVMQIGFVYGGAASLLLGGMLIAAVSQMHVSLPYIGSLHTWQVIFLIMAIPDLLLCILMLTTVHEPARRGVRAKDATGARPKVVPVREVFGFLNQNRKAFGPMFGALAANSLAMGTGAWAAPFYQRTYGWGPAQYGIIQGLILVIISPIGLLAGGLLAEKLAKKGYDDANLRVVFLCTLLHIPFAILFPLMPTPQLALALSALNTTILVAGAGPQNAALQVIVPNEMRGQVTALFLFSFTMIGIGIAPTVVALLTDYVFGAESQLRYSMVSMHALLGPLAALIFWYGLKPYGRAFAQARSWH